MTDCIVETDDPPFVPQPTHDFDVRLHGEAAGPRQLEGGRRPARGDQGLRFFACVTFRARRHLPHFHLISAHAYLRSCWSWRLMNIDSVLLVDSFTVGTVLSLFYFRSVVTRPDATDALCRIWYTMLYAKSQAEYLSRRNTSSPPTWPASPSSLANIIVQWPASNI